MKTRFVKSVVALLGAYGLVAMFVGTAAGEASGRVEGTWENQITVTDCNGHVIRSFPSLTVFMPGGSCTEASGGTAPSLQTGGKGVWSHISANSYAFRFKDFNFNAQGVFTGWTIIAGVNTLDRSGDAGTGTATIDVYAPTGVLIVHLCADTVATRFEL